MKPHARRGTSESSSASAVDKPLPSIPSVPSVPPIQTQPFSPRTPKSPISYSPSIKRKPLPSTALSPPPKSQPATSRPPPLPEPSTAGRTIIPPSSNTLNHFLETTPEKVVQGSPSTSQDLQPSHITDSPLPISSQDFPIPLVAEPSSPTTDETLDPTSKGKGMGLRPGERPPPLRMDSVNSIKSMDQKKPQSPGNKFTSFFSRKPQPSPGGDSAVTEISDGRSPMPSPYPNSDSGSGNFANSYFNFGLGRSNTHGSQDSMEYAQNIRSSSDARFNALEAELKEITVELANSIRREIDLEDIVDRLQTENPRHVSGDRTSDYFSDSGTSSLRADGSELTAKEEMEKMKRDSEQQRAQLKLDLTQKWQDEANQRKAAETAFEDVRRKLLDERKANKNFEDIAKALRGELEQNRTSMSKMQQEIQYLKDENTALVSAREMERGLKRGSMHNISEEGEYGYGGPNSRNGGLARSNTGRRGSLARSGSLSRSNSMLARPIQGIDTFESAVERIKTVEQQRDALHNTVRYLLTRQDLTRRQFAKKARMLEAELDRTQNTSPQPRKGGYEREVRVLRSEINTLRKRADDALDQKWQCEKNLAGLKMDLDRNKQETASLQRLLQAKGSDPEIQGLMSATLESAIVEMQKERARIQESAAQIQKEEHLATQLEEYATRSEALATQVKKQLQNNAALRSRLKLAVESGEQNQQISADQINDLQSKLRKLEDSISAAQTQSETSVMKHEEEVRILHASHNAQLMRALSTNRKSNPNLLVPTVKSPLSPMFANSKKSPRIDKTSSGPGMALHEALRTEYLENKVTDLEKALSETENEIGKIVGKMNQAQINVAELEAERDEALRLTRKLEARVQEERVRYADLIRAANEW